MVSYGLPATFACAFAPARHPSAQTNPFPLYLIFNIMSLSSNTTRTFWLRAHAGRATWVLPPKRCAGFAGTEREPSRSAMTLDRSGLAPAYGPRAPCRRYGSVVREGLCNPQHLFEMRAPRGVTKSRAFLPDILLASGL